MTYIVIRTTNDMDSNYINNVMIKTSVARDGY